MTILIRERRIPTPPFYVYPNADFTDIDSHAIDGTDINLRICDRPSPSYTVYSFIEVT